VPPRRLARAFDIAVEHSVVLPLGAIVALIWANTAAGSYVRIAHALQFIVNDIGMAFFFALATKEVVEATAPGGVLHPWRRAALPVVAATGGMIGPALIYVALVLLWRQPLLLRGWAIPCATDIAFSYLVAKAIFGGGHPAVPFLLLLAIADDALGLIVLALFYPIGDLHLLVGSVLMAAALGVSLALRRRKTLNFWPYILAGGALSWCALFWGGLHPALALVPIVPFLPHATRDPGLFVPAPAEARDPLSELEHRWKYPVQIVLLFFGLANAGVEVQQVGTGTWVVLSAILAGKPIGIAAMVATAVGAGLHLPARVTWRDLIVVGFAAAIGFTVALFFAIVAFPAGPLLNQAKMGALLSISGSVAAVGAAVLLRVGRFETRTVRP
jgi:NhaA family Na+:H+ antiporter